MFTFSDFGRVLCISAFITALLAITQESFAAAPNRGVLANELFRGQPIKGLFFSRDSRDVSIYTAHPINEADKHWLSQSDTHRSVIDRIIGTGANVIVLSYWGNMQVGERGRKIILVCELAHTRGCRAPSKFEQLQIAGPWLARRRGGE